MTYTVVTQRIAEWPCRNMLFESGSLEDDGMFWGRCIPRYMPIVLVDGRSITTCELKNNTMYQQIMLDCDCGNLPYGRG